MGFNSIDINVTIINVCVGLPSYTLEKFENISLKEENKNLKLRDHEIQENFNEGTFYV